MLLVKNGILEGDEEGADVTEGGHVSFDDEGTVVSDGSRGGDGGGVVVGGEGGDGGVAIRKNPGKGSLVFFTTSSSISVAL